MAANGGSEFLDRGLIPNVSKITDVAFRKVVYSTIA